MKLLSKVLAIWAMFSFAGMPLLPMYAPKSWELPLSVSPNVVVDNAGQIYCGTRGYGQIQVYDEDGVFLRRWNTAGSGPRKLELTSTGLLRVYETRGRYVAVYESDGTMISREVASLTPAGDPDTQETSMSPQYEMRGSILLPGHVVRIDENGAEVDVIPARLYWFPFQAPFPSYIIGVIGMALWYVDRRLCRK